MPELPDITVYVEALATRLVGQPLRGVRLLKPFVLRSVQPAPESLVDVPVSAVERLGKRIVLAFANGSFGVVHLMIAGRLHWSTDRHRKPPAHTLVVFGFDNGQLLFTEAGSKRRASLHLLPDRSALAALDPGGLELPGVTLAAFAARLRAANHTLKRALTDPHIFSGIGNSYSDEILHAARLSPLQQTRHLDDAEVARLHVAVQTVLETWTTRLRNAAAGAFPDQVTAFHPQMAVHGRYKLPCPDCGSPVQRIVHSDHEFNYCATCQTGGRVLADRLLSRLLHDSFPRELS